VNFIEIQSICPRHVRLNPVVMTSVCTTPCLYSHILCGTN